MFRKILLVLFVVAISFLLLPDQAAAANCDPNNIIFSEIDYSQPGTDNSEFVEVYFETAATVSECEVHIVNGDGSLATSFSLDGPYSTGEFVLLGFMSQTMLNGTGGVALVGTSGGTTVLELISYEGEVTYLETVSTDIGCIDENTATTTEADSCHNGPVDGHSDWEPAPPSPGVGEPTAITLSGFNAGIESNSAQVLGLSFFLLAFTGLAGWVLNRRRSA